MMSTEDDWCKLEDLVPSGCYVLACIKLRSEPETCNEEPSEKIILINYFYFTSYKYIIITLYLCII